MLEFFAFVSSVSHHLHICLSYLNIYMWEEILFSLHSILGTHDLVSALYSAEGKKCEIVRMILENIKLGVYLFIKVTELFMPGHFLTMPSNYASQQELLLHGEKALSDNLNPPAKLLDYTSQTKS